MNSILTFGNFKDLTENIDKVTVSDSVHADIEDCHKIISPSTESLVVFTQNIRSINCNFNGLELLLTRLNLHCDVLVLTESWLSCTTSIPNLPGYRSAATKNNVKQNDGVVILYKEHLRFKIVEPEFSEGNCLIATIKNKIAIVAIYRSPSFSNIDTFLKSLDDVLTNYSSFDNIIVIGDINIAINIDKIDLQGERYLNLAASHGLLPAHTLTTRPDSKTCIDHILLKTKSTCSTIVPIATLTDHYPVLLHMKFKKTQQFAITTIKKIDEDGLKEEISKIDFTVVYESQDPNISLMYITHCLQAAINNNTKVITLSRRKKIIKPWITQGLLRCMRNRDKLHKKLKLSPDNATLKLTYTRYRNHCNTILKKVKRTYEKNLVKSVQNDNKKLWKVIKDVTNTNKNTSCSTELLSLADDPKHSLNKVNSHFVDVGRSLADKIRQNKSNILDTNVDTNSDVPHQLNSFVLEDTDEFEVDHLIINLKTDSSTGYDGISSKFLKIHKNILVTPLTFVFNSCLQNGIFPKSLKKSEVCPIYKGGDRDCITNYRPISILPALSKILERIINVRLTRYLESKNLLSPNQYGFRNGKSTEQAVNKLTSYISDKLDGKTKCLTIFLDLAKAFDTISVSVLLAKLERLGIRGTQLKLFESYLTDRYQCVRVGNVTSTDLPVTHGVPQGSILGPTLFLVYINDLTNLKLTKGEIVSFADDTALLFSAVNWRDVFDAAQSGFNTVRKWLNDNVLTLNIDKTKYICFSIRPDLDIDHTYAIIPHECTPHGNCSCSKIERVESTKYLGVTIDRNLNFKEHIRILTGRVRRLIYIFKNIRHIVDPPILKRIYFALCQSLITYCISVWGGAPKTTLKSIEVAQRAILKVSTFKPILFSTAALYQLCGVLTVRQLFILKIILMQHSQIIYDPQMLNKRRNYTVFKKHRTSNTKFVTKFSNSLGPFIYNKLNKVLNIYPLNTDCCRRKVLEYLQSLTYDETEQLLTVLR